LTAEKIRPWRYHSSQHILAPQAFLERAVPALRLYERARERLQSGIWVVCVDEKTSIQARKSSRAPDPALPEHPGHVSHRDKRRGALRLFGALSVAHGKVLGKCCRRKRVVDFQAFLPGAVIPEALARGVHTLALILNNSTTHAPKQLGCWLQAQIERHSWALEIQI
jgi:hypothetical protein